MPPTSSNRADASDKRLSQTRSGRIIRDRSASPRDLVRTVDPIDALVEFHRASPRQLFSNNLKDVVAPSSISASLTTTPVKRASVTIRVGEGDNCRDFQVDKNILCARTPFFQSAFNGQWKEGVSGILPLPDVEVQSFETYVKFIYKEGNWFDYDASKYTTRRRMLVKFFIRTYGFAEQIQDLEFADAILDALRVVGHAEISLVYELTSAQSPLRRLLVDDWVDKGSPGPLICMNYEIQIYKDIAVRCLEVRSNPNLKRQFALSKNQCAYHYHTRSAASCYKSRGFVPIAVVEKQVQKKVDPSFESTQTGGFFP